MNRYRLHLYVGFAVMAIGVAGAEVHHGVWFWGSTTLPDSSSSPYGSTVVVGDVAKENDLIIFFDYHDVKRVYGSYQNRPVSEPAVIAAWNGKLDAAGIQSQLLIDGDAVNDPARANQLGRPPCAHCHPGKGRTR